MAETWSLNSNTEGKYSFQYFLNNDRVNGSLPGREVASDPDARMVNTVTAKVGPVFTVGAHKIEVGLSGLYGTLRRQGHPDFHLRQIAGNISWATPDFKIFGEVLQQKGIPYQPVEQSRPGYENALYLLAVTHLTFIKNWEIRLNSSAVKYQSRGAFEFELLPALAYRFHKKFEFIVEYNNWQMRDSQKDSYQWIDNSYNFVLHYTF